MFLWEVGPQQVMTELAGCFITPTLALLAPALRGGPACHHSSLDIVSKQQSERRSVLVFLIMFKNILPGLQQHVSGFRVPRRASSQMMLLGHLCTGEQASFGVYLQLKQFILSIFLIFVSSLKWSHWHKLILILTASPPWILDFKNLLYFNFIFDHHHHIIPP